MMNPELYTAIFKRKSIRKYDMTPLPQERIEELLAFSERTVRLDESIRLEFAVLSGDKINGMFSIKAPHYLCLYSEKKEGYLINSGFTLQQMDLFLSANNIGVCWLGGAKPGRDTLASKNGLDFVIMLAFGNVNEPLHRENTSEFKRNSLQEITSIQEAGQLLEPVRLAPSARNTQTWFFSGALKEIIVSRKKMNFIKDRLFGRLSTIDTGIALCHLILSAEQQGKSAVIDFSGGNVPEGHEFAAKVRLGE